MNHVHYMKAKKFVKVKINIFIGIM